LSNSGIKSNDSKYKNHISEIIQEKLIDLHGRNGYKSIMQTMMKTCGKTEKEIIADYELFAELTEGVFGRFSDKILDPIKLEIQKIGVKNIHQEEKQAPKIPIRILIADDDLDILGLYRSFLEAKGKEITLTTDGHKCVEVYKRKYNSQQSENYFDLVILDQKMPFMTGLQAAVEILKINPQQRIMFASGFIEKTLLDILSKLNRAIAVIEKPFSLDVLEHMINNITIFEKLEKMNINQQEKDIKQKVSEIMTILQNQI
jgi:CheY-like chemotaxis protein